MENAKKARKPISPFTQSEILESCRRRCALCFWLSGDLEEKHGQIAHLDDDPSNNADDNLAFLCLPHHSVYDSKTRQHKNYTLEEAKRAQAALHSAIEEGQHIGQPGSSSRIKADAATLSDLLELLPSTGVIQSIRDTDFAGTYDRAALDPIRLFIYERNGPEHEFLNQEIENLRQTFRANCIRLMSELGVHSFPLISGTFSRVPSEWKLEQPELFTKVIQSIHLNADAVCESYDLLIRTARQRLNS